jgi:hypothetical protein
MSETDRCPACGSHRCSVCGVPKVEGPKPCTEHAATVVTTGRGAHTNTYGQNDLEAFFEKSGLIQERWLGHSPFLVFRVDGLVVRVVQSFSALDLVRDHPDDAQVMVQWPGRWRSDYFCMTVGDVRAELVRRGTLDERPPEVSGRKGICTDCKRHTGSEEIGQSCRMTQPPHIGGASRPVRCRGRIVVLVTAQGARDSVRLDT